MRAFNSLFSLVVFLPCLLVAQQTVTLTPQTLTGWTITGVDPRSLDNQSVLTLPPGAQLARTFVGTDLSLQVTTRPIISTNAEDWPVLEIGSAALVFSRNGPAGRLLLVLGDNAPVELPFNFSLDANGLSTESLVIGFMRQGTMVTVSFSGRVQQVPAGSAKDDSLEVVTSAGASQPWAFEQLGVTVGSFTPISSSAPATNNVSFSTLSNSGLVPVISPAKGGASGPVAIFTPSGYSSVAASAGSKSSSTTSLVTKSAKPLEVFTPPSVRHGRVESVRAAAAAAIKTP